MLSVLKIPIYSADDRAKWLMNHDHNLVQGIKSLIGPDSYKDGSLNRALLASKVFGDRHLLDEVNALVHPAVKVDFDHWTEQQKSKVVAKEAALLFETGGYRDLDKTWLVTSPLELRVSRVSQRDPQRTREEILSIIGKQWDDPKKEKLADYIIKNDDKQLVIPQVLAGVEGIRP